MLWPIHGVQDYMTDPMANVFHNGTLKTMLYTAWRHVAAHYASWGNIAAYEVMAEPRDKTASPQVVRGNILAHQPTHIHPHIHPPTHTPIHP